PANKNTSGGAGGAGANGTTLNSISGSSSGNTGQLAPASSSSGANASTDTNVASLPSELDRKIVRTATLTLRADNVAERFQDASSIASQLGGFVSNSTFGNSGSKQTASISIRVPGERSQDALVQLRKLGDVKDENSNGNPANATGPLQTARRAFDASLVVLLGLSTAILAVGAFSWWLLPLGVGGWVLARKSLRASRERRVPPSA